MAPAWCGKVRCARGGCPPTRSGKIDDSQACLDATEADRELSKTATKPMRTWDLVGC
jgi:hypothetical protein